MPKPRPRGVGGTIAAVVVYPFRLVLRTFLVVVTAVLLGFARGLGAAGKPRIRDPERPNKETYVVRK